MLRIIQNHDAAAAKGYYTRDARSDYYLGEGQEIVGEWGGKGAARLNLRGTVDKAAFEALCDNLHPATGERLTPRRRDDRRVGYDFNFHVPKSVSVLYGLTGDQALLDAFRASVEETMWEIEQGMKARVRKAGKDEDRRTGNAVWAEFLHTTARPVAGEPDPHLHAHCFLFNVTWDHEEKSWKAGQFGDLKRDAPYYQAVFHARLAHRLAALGYPIERTADGWEIAGLPAETLRKFSRRTEVIERMAESKGITDPEAKAALGAATRRRKQEDRTLPELRQCWMARLTDQERLALEAMTEKRGRPSPALSPDEAVGFAVRHSFERSAVVPETQLLAAALNAGVGSITPEAVRSRLTPLGVLTAEKQDRRLATTREVLAEERRMIDFASLGLGICRPLGEARRPVTRDWLNADQRAAVRHVVSSPHRVIAIRGAAGTGKTTLMQEAAEAIEEGGHKVFVFAPSAEASRGVLRQEGFENADTVARLLLDDKLQQQLQGQVIWIDEASLLGTRTLARVFEVARQQRARVILSGDNRQHGAVERGDVLRVLEELGGIQPVEVRQIQRQTGDYKAAIGALAEGRAEEGFSRLDALGWIESLPEGEREARLAADYSDALSAGHSTLVVSPTHAEGARITEAIRDHLKAAGRIGGGEHEVLRLVNRNLTEAERGSPTRLQTGDWLVFHQNAKGIQRGARLEVTGEPEQELPLAVADRFQVYRPEALRLAPGDMLRITANGYTLDRKHRLNNGAIYGVKGFTENGHIVLENGWVVAKDYGHISHGYVMTSHASQGKTVDHVFIGQSAASLPASSREQFYVSASRARKSVRIYTDDKAALKDAIRRPEERMAAHDLVNRPKPKNSRPGRLFRLLRRRQQLASLARLRAAYETVPTPVPGLQARLAQRQVTHER